MVSSININQFQSHTNFYYTQFESNESLNYNWSIHGIVRWLALQLLLIHSDYIEFEAKRPTKFAEDIEDSAKKGRLEEACAPS